MNYVRKTCKLKLSKNVLSDFMYAIIMCKVRLIASHGIGVYELTRQQNARHVVDVMLELSPSSVSDFEDLSGVQLIEPVVAKVQ